MKRALEPELMSDKVQAEACANAGFEKPDQLFIDTFSFHFPSMEITGTCRLFYPLPT